MNTILTDDELPPMPDGTHPQSLLGQMLLKYADAREAAVLAKLAQPEDIKRESKPRMYPNTFNYCSRSCGDGDCRDFVDAFPASNVKNGGAA